MQTPQDKSIYYFLHGIYLQAPDVSHCINFNRTKIMPDPGKSLIIIYFSFT